MDVIPGEASARGVHRGGRFVQQQDPGTVERRPDQRDLLAHALAVASNPDVGALVQAEEAQ